MENPDMLKIWVWLQQQDIDPNEGCDFIVGDGCVHFSWLSRLACYNMDVS